MPRIIPFGDRILVKRRTVGDKIGKAGIIVAPDQVKDAKTDLADVVSVPDLIFADSHILKHAEKIVKALTEKAEKGSSEALISLLRINEFVKMKSIKPGDAVMIGKYVGTDFHDDDPQNELTLVREAEIIGLVVGDE